MADIGIDVSEFQIAMKGVVRETGRLMKLVVREQMALWSKDLMASTIPTDKFSAGTQTEGMSAFKIGKNAIQNDLEKIFEPIRNPAVLAIWSNSDDGRGNQIIYRKTKTGLMKIDLGLLKMTIAGWHRQHRRKRDGRTWMQKDRGFSWGGRYPAPATELARYATEVKGHVGKTRAGWIPAIFFFCSKTSGVVKPSIPAWVMRHSGFGKSNGVYQEGGNEATGEFYGMSGNNVPWIRDDGMLAATKQTRLADMNRGWYAVRLQRVMNSYSPINAAGAA